MRVQGSGFRVQDSNSRDRTWSRSHRNGEPCRHIPPQQSPAFRGTKYSVLSTPYSALTALALCVFGTLSAAESNPLADLAAKCGPLGLDEQATITRTWAIPRHPGRQYLFLPAASDPAAPKTGATKVVSQWYDRFLAIRRERAAALFDAAKKANDEKQATTAYQLLHETLREDPDHREARRILGYIKNGSGSWTLPGWGDLAVETARTRHPQLGWPPGDYFRLDTPHFQIVTNHSKGEALEAGRELEKLDQLWRQIFFRFWSTPEALAARFAGKNEPLAPPRPKMQVVLFKNRQEYIAQLAPVQPQARLTLGTYMHKQHIAYFFAGDKSVYPTWYHEATHQLFQESIAAAVDEPGSERNFWAVEGAALYMESLAEHEGYWTAGGCESDRLQYARYRARSGNFLLPGQRLAALGLAAMQNDPNIQPLYAQSAGWAHFLIDGQDGKHREAFVDLLRAIYAGSDQFDSLAKLTGQPLAALDEAYLPFLNVTDDDLAGIPDPARMKNLSLMKTAITDNGLTRLTACKDLVWLDLSGSTAGDRGLKALAANTNLKQLFLDGSRVTSASLPLIGNFKGLKELDLSKLPLDDASLALLAGLKNLDTLYLSNTPLTDACLAHLRGFKQLETLDTDGTQITPASLKRLQTGLPKLKLRQP